MGDSVNHRGDGIDFVADVEIDGTPISVTDTSVSFSGGWANVGVTATATERIQLYKVIFHPSADISGIVYFRLGSVTAGSITDPKAGQQYLLFAGNPNYLRGELGDDLQMLGPNATAGRVDIYYKMES